MATPMVRGSGRRSGVMRIMTCSFLTDGATDPSVFGGDARAVRRLEDGGALPFFRVKLTENIDVTSQDVQVTFGVHSDAGTTAFYTVQVGDITAAPVTTKGQDEFDVVLALAGVPTDTAGVKIDISIVRA